MKKITIILIIIFNTKIMISQSFYGQAEYYSKMITEKDTTSATDKKKNKRKAFEDAWAKASRKASEKKHRLFFNAEESIYERIENLQRPNPSSKKGMRVVISINGNGFNANRKYINLKKNVKIVEDDIFGKRFLISDKFECQNWTLLKEIKKIGNYTCYKAETIIKPTKEKIKAYEDYLKKKNTFLFPKDKPKDEIITVWYTLEIPVSFGPNSYCGLPGLILEVSSKNEITLCSEIILNGPNRKKIKAPKRGKKVTQKKFDEIERKKMNSRIDD